MQEFVSYQTLNMQLFSVNKNEVAKYNIDYRKWNVTKNTLAEKKKKSFDFLNPHFYLNQYLSETFGINSWNIQQGILKFPIQHLETKRLININVYFYFHKLRQFEGNAFYF